MFRRWFTLLGAGGLGCAPAPRVGTPAVEAPPRAVVPSVASRMVPVWKEVPTVARVYPDAAPGGTTRWLVNTLRVELRDAHATVARDPFPEAVSGAFPVGDRWRFVTRSRAFEALTFLGELHEVRGLSDGLAAVPARPAPVTEGDLPAGEPRLAAAIDRSVWPEGLGVAVLAPGSLALTEDGARWREVLLPWDAAERCLALGGKRWALGRRKAWSLAPDGTAVAVQRDTVPLLEPLSMPVLELGGALELDRDALGDDHAPIRDWIDALPFHREAQIIALPDARTILSVGVRATVRYDLADDAFVPDGATFFDGPIAQVFPLNGRLYLLVQQGDDRGYAVLTGDGAGPWSTVFRMAYCNNGSDEPPACYPSADGKLWACEFAAATSCDAGDYPSVFWDGERATTRVGQAQSLRGVVGGHPLFVRGDDTAPEFLLGQDAAAPLVPPEQRALFEAHHIVALNDFVVNGERLVWQDLRADGTLATIAGPPGGPYREVPGSSLLPSLAMQPDHTLVQQRPGGGPPEPVSVAEDVARDILAPLGDLEASCAFDACTLEASWTRLGWGPIHSSRYEGFSLPAPPWSPPDPPPDFALECTRGDPVGTASDRGSQPPLDWPVGWIGPDEGDDDTRWALTLLRPSAGRTPTRTASRALRFAEAPEDEDDTRWILLGAQRREGILVGCSRIEAIVNCTVYALDAHGGAEALDEFEEDSGSAVVHVNSEGVSGGWRLPSVTLENERGGAILFGDTGLRHADRPGRGTLVYLPWDGAPEVRPVTYPADAESTVRLWLQHGEAGIAWPEGDSAMRVAPMHGPTRTVPARMEAAPCRRAPAARTARLVPLGERTEGTAELIEGVAQGVRCPLALEGTDAPDEYGLRNRGIVWARPKHGRFEGLAWGDTDELVSIACGVKAPVP